MPHPRCVAFRTHFKKLSVPAAALVDALSDIPQSEPLRQVPDGQRLRSKSDVPVSRGRRVKKTSAGSGGRTRAPVLDRPRSGLSTLISQVGSPTGPGRWFDPAIAAVLDQAHVVLEAQHPRALEQLTSS